jgi:hypothetical protein
MVAIFPAEKPLQSTLAHCFHLYKRYLLMEMGIRLGMINYQLCAKVDTYLSTFGNF